MWQVKILQRSGVKSYHPETLAAEEEEKKNKKNRECLLTSYIAWIICIVYGQNGYQREYPKTNLLYLFWTFVFSYVKLEANSEIFVCFWLPTPLPSFSLYTNSAKRYAVISLSTKQWNIVFKK